MRKSIVAAMLLLVSCAGFAQKVTVPEPEFVGGYTILTSDSTADMLPKESGAIKKHQSKFGKFSKIAGAASQIGVAGAVVGLSTSNFSGAVTGLRVAGTAAGVGIAADAVNTLAGAEGMDIVFSGGESPYKVKDTKHDIRLVIKGENNETDPMNLYRIVRFKDSKKDRRIQWMEIKPALLGISDSKKRGFLPFTGHKYGEKSYLITIPAAELEPGEYGIFFMSIITATELPIGTFSVGK